MHLIGFILCCALCAFWTWLTISLSMLGKFSTIISSKKIFADTLYTSSFSEPPIFWMLVHLILFPEVSETTLNYFHYFYFILFFNSFYHYSSSFIHSSSSVILLLPPCCCCCSVSVVSDSLWPHGLWHTGLPCASASPRACTNSCPLSQWCHSTILSSVTSVSSCHQSFPAPGLFSNESTLCIRCPMYWSFTFSISLSNKYSGLISFRSDWFDLLAAQRTLGSLLQHHSSKASII